MADQPLQGSASQSDVHCTCPPEGFSESCPWARAELTSAKWARYQEIMARRESAWNEGR